MSNAPVTEIDIRTQQAQRNLDQLRQAFDSAGKTAKGLGDALTTQNETYLKLAAATDTAARSRLQYEALERRAGAALDANKISAEQYSRILDAQTEKLRKVAEAQGQMANSAKSAGESLQSIGAQFGRFAGYAAAVYGVYQAFSAAKDAIAAAGDQVAMITVRANLATEKLTGGGQSFAEIARIAQAVGAPLDATANLFARIGRSAAEAGATSVQEVSRATEIVSKLGVASGASTQEASASALQLGQALASGRLQGDELRSILENMPALGSAIAKEFGVGVGQLRDMGAAGELVSDRVLKAILNAGTDADRMFAALPKTVDRASQEMSNAWTIFLAQLDKSLGVSKGIVANMERARGIAEGATKMVAGPTPDERLAELRQTLAKPPSPDGSRVVDAGGFGPTLARGEGPVFRSGEEQRVAILKQIQDLENQIEKDSIAADRENTKRGAAQIKALQDRLAALDKERAAEIAKAEYKTKMSKQALDEMAAYDKAYTDSRAKTTGMDAATQDAQAKRAGEHAVELLRLKETTEARWKADSDGARAAEKAASDAARQAERNGTESTRRAKEEADNSNNALRAVEQQIDRLGAEAAAIGVGARERAVLAERLKAEQVLKKGLVDIDQELYQGELKRVELAAGQKFDTEKGARDTEKAVDQAKRIAEKQAEEAERPMRNLFDNLQRGTAQIFEGLFSGSLKTGDALKKVLLKAASEYLTAIAITPAFRTVGSALGIGSGQDGGAKSGGGIGMPSFSGGGLLDGITNRIDSFGYNTLGIGRTAAEFGAAPGEAINAIGGSTGVSGSISGGLSSYLPYVGAGVGVLTNLASGNVAGAATTAAGAAIGSIIPGVGTAIGAAVGGALGSFFGGKKPTVGPGGGIGFGVGADGKVNVGFSSRDNGYDPVAKNLDAAQSVADAAGKIIERLGGRFTGTANSGRGGELGYDAGLKKYTGGDDTSNGRGRFDTIEQAMAASVTTIIKNATTDGLSKDIQDRLSKVASQQDLEGLLQYVDGLKAVRDAFVNWKEPMNQTEAAMASLKSAFDQAKAAAESLSSSTDDVQASYEKQRLKMVGDFNKPLEERYLRATNQNAAADEMVRAAQEADLRKSAAALGTEAVIQVEKTLAAERTALEMKAVTEQRAVIEQGLSQRKAQAQAAADALGGVLNGLASAMNSALQAWQGVADSVAKFNASLGLSALSPLSPEDQLGLARSQYQDLLGRAMGGDVTAAQGVTGAAQTLLERGRGYYASSAGYSDLYGQITGDLSGLSKYADGDAQTRVQEQYAAIFASLRDQQQQTLRGFASGGVINPGETARVHPGELLYTGPASGPTRVFNARETSAILGGGGMDLSRLEAKMDQLIRVVSASGQMNAETQAQMAEALAAIRRKANLARAA